MSLDRDTQRVERWLLDGRARLPLPDAANVLPRVLTQLVITPQRGAGRLGGLAPTRATTTLASRSRLLVALAVLLLTSILLAVWVAMGSQPSQRALPPPLTFAPASIAFGPADDVYLAAADGTSPTLFDPGGSEDDSVQSITFAPDGTSVASARRAGTATTRQTESAGRAPRRTPTGAKASGAASAFTCPATGLNGLAALALRPAALSTGRCAFALTGTRRAAETVGVGVERTVRTGPPAPRLSRTRQGH